MNINLVNYELKSIFSQSDKIDLTIFFVLLYLFFIVEAEARNWSDLRAKAENSIVFIESTQKNRDGTNVETLTATGFIVSPTGHILTVNHAIHRKSDSKITSIYASVRSKENKRIKVNLVTRDEEVDLALLLLPNVQEWSPLPLQKNASTRIDETLYMLGFPLNRELSSATGLLSNLHSERGRWQTTLPINRGNSGSPVFNEYGKVVAVATGGFEEAKLITFVTPMSFSRAILSRIPEHKPKLIGSENINKDSKNPASSAYNNTTINTQTPRVGPGSFDGDCYVPDSQAMAEWSKGAGEDKHHSRDSNLIAKSDVKIEDGNKKKKATVKCQLEESAGSRYGH